MANNQLVRSFRKQGHWKVFHEMQFNREETACPAVICETERIRTDSDKSGGPRANNVRYGRATGTCHRHPHVSVTAPLVVTVTDRSITAVAYRVSVCCARIESLIYRWQELLGTTPTIHKLMSRLSLIKLDNINT